MTAFLPANLLHVAAQFAATDEYKQVLTGIMVKPAEDGVQIESTDGTRAFRVTVSDGNWRCDAPMLLNAKAFKKRIPYARFAAFEGEADTARILGGKGPNAEFLQSIPCQWKREDYKGDPVAAYPNTDRLWPDRFGRGAEDPIAFNAALMGDFLAACAKLSWNGTVVMERNGPHNPIVLTSTIRDTWLEDVKMRFLLMPVQIRS